ncbi:MAG: hypothetical protein L7W43_07340 [Rubripirellula sp.]|nr:hypothetical protein [Rubripirellula sp.]
MTSSVGAAVRIKPASCLQFTVKTDGNSEKKDLAPAFDRPRGVCGLMRTYKLGRL